MEKYAKLAADIRKMNPKQIVLNMIDGLENPVTKIDMGTFGHKGKRGVCFGCAATNAICRLGNFNPKEVLMDENLVGNSRKYSNNGYVMREDDRNTIYRYELAIDSLRNADLRGFNHHANIGGFKKFSKEDYDLFNSLNIGYLDNENYLDELPGFKEFAEGLNYV